MPRKRNAATPCSCHKNASSTSHLRKTPQSPASSSLLALGGLDLVGLLHDLAKHDNTVAVQERDAAQALAVLERVDNERLLRREGQLRHLVRLQRVRLLQLLATRLLADPPGHLRDAARRAAAAHEADRGVADPH